MLKFPKPGFGLSSFDAKSCVLSKHYMPLLFGSIWAELRDDSPVRLRFLPSGRQGTEVALSNGASSSSGTLVCIGGWQEMGGQ